MDLKRRLQPLPSQLKKGSPLPLDYLRMVTELYTTHFDAGLKALSKIKSNPHFLTSGTIYPDEVLLCLSLLFKGDLASLSLFASSDFDPSASSPSLEDLLSAQVDAIGALFDGVLDPKNPDQLNNVAQVALYALEEVPLEWTPVVFNGRKIFLKADKSNPGLDQMTDEWLSKNDPKLMENELAEEQEVKKLFIGRPKKPVS